ncbi:hypothetical protein GCM10023091_34560 [Ravibacter arvi]|uniref:Uncharacterized protein n=1 Tax=Ravibacter arvi TaxID=2051041 RepID=A0ABP8M6X4_9BACT
MEIGNRNFSYVIDHEGRNLSFLDLKSGKDYLADDSTSFCAYVKKDKVLYHPSAVNLSGEQLEIRFDSAAVVAYVSFQSDKDRVIFKVDSVAGKLDALTFVNIPLKLEAVPDEPFAACLLSLNLKTHVQQLPALQDHLWATSYEKFGLSGAEAAMIGVPQQEILPAIRTVMKSAADIPFSDKGGAWAQSNKEGYGSYLMDFGTLTEKTVDEWIARCDSLGFNQIAIHGAHYFFKNGDLELHKDKWPGGWADFKKINARLHQAGISSILLTYAYFIEKSSKYVTPVPSEDLGYFNAFTLNADIGAGDTEVEVRESTAEVSNIIGYFIQNSVTLRIGEELVEFAEVTKTPPYKFRGLKRGVNGTRAQAHAAGEKGYHLQQMFGLFVPGPETGLFNEIARKTARIVNENNFDGIYFDAIDGNNMLGGKENAWHYGSKFVFETARHLKPMVGMEMCDMPHHYWHYSSRWQAWDKAVRGYKRFVDVHMAALKSNDHRHGEWIGYTGSINRLAPMNDGRLMLPLHMGWWGNHTWEPPQVETTFPDDMEYLLCKMIGNDAGLSMLGGTDEKTLNEKPLFRKLVALTRKYERLRQQGYFSEAVKAQLRQPGKEFTLVEENGKWGFRPVTYQKHTVSGLEGGWSLDNPYDGQPVRVRIHPLMSVAPFEAAGNIMLADTGDLERLKPDGAAAGVTGSISKSAGGDALVFTAHHDGSSPREGAWIKWQKVFEPCLNLKTHQGMGAWIKGDGSGALLNLRLESPKHLSMGGRGDHFVKLDFKGWRYFELVEVESAAFNDYLWPDEYHNVYNSYLYKVVFDCVDKLQVWINNVPAGKTVSAEIRVVKALPLEELTIENPVVSIGKNTLTFPVKITPGMYLEYESMSDCRLFSPQGAFIQNVVPSGTALAALPGKNDIRMSVKTEGKVLPRVSVSVMTKGKMLED